MIETTTGKWEIIIGLEVHAQVISKSKLFSSASTKFGVAPNENVSFVDAALPGVLPVLNSFCVDQAIKTGLGLHSTINKISYFDRKNYFYADLPQGYQITQFFHPIVSGGYVTIIDEDGKFKHVNCERIHLEQDAGKSIHDQSPTNSYIDLNRAGIALMEIVTKPDMRSAAEAAAFVRRLRSLLRYLGTCDGNMDEGSMRVDVNVSVHRPDTPFGTRAEIKNVNSIKFIETAIDYEVNRQISILESGGTVDQETRLFDSTTGTTRTMRSKEDAQDYRYFPEPDLPPLILNDERIENLRKMLPELPDEKSQRLQKDLGLPQYDAEIITDERELADFYELALSHIKNADQNAAKMLSNWLIGDLFALLNKHGKSITESNISAMNLGELINMIRDDVISGKIAKDVIELMWTERKSPAVIVEEHGWQQITNTEAIEKTIRFVLDDNADKVVEYKSGKEKLFGFFVGQCMKKTQGKANPQILNDILKKVLSE